MAKATVSRHIKNAKTMIDNAVKARVIESNPFADLKPGSQVNQDRDHFITPAVAKQVLDVCPRFSVAVDLSHSLDTVVFVAAKCWR